jgi:hypothetical protein
LTSIKVLLDFDLLLEWTWYARQDHR